MAKKYVVYCHRNIEKQQLVKYGERLRKVDRERESKREREREISNSLQKGEEVGTSIHEILVLISVLFILTDVEEKHIHKYTNGWTNDRTDILTLNRESYGCAIFLVQLCKLAFTNPQ